MSRLTRDGTAEPVSRDQILRCERGQGNIHFPLPLTMSRIDNLTGLIHNLAICVAIMVTTRYSDRQGSKSRHNPCQVQPTENMGNFGYRLQFLLSGVLAVFQNLSYKLHQRLRGVLPIQQSHQKRYNKFFSSY